MIETLFGLLTMTFSIGIPVAIVVVTHEQAKRVRAQRMVALAAFGRSFGLVPGGPDLIFGHVQGVPVRVWYETRGSNKNPARYTVVEARIEPPLDLGLVLKKADTIGSLWGQLVGAQDHVLGDPAFDATFLVRGDEPARIAALLDPSLRPDLVRLSRAFDVEINDLGVRFEMRDHRVDPATAAMLDAAIRIAIFVSGRRRYVPPARAIAEHLVAWQRTAASLGFTFHASPLAVVGELDGGPVSACAWRIAPFHFVTRVNATFTRPLPFHLAVRPTTTMGFDFFSSESDDAQIGDPAFDRRFYLRTDRTDLATRALAGEGVARVLRLAERGSIEIDSFGVSLKLVNLGPPGALAALLSEVRALADTIYAATDAAPRQQGAYR